MNLEEYQNTLSLAIAIMTIVSMVIGFIGMFRKIGKTEERFQQMGDDIRETKNEVHRLADKMTKISDKVIEIETNNKWLMNFINELKKT